VIRILSAFNGVGAGRFLWYSYPFVMIDGPTKSKWMLSDNSSFLYFRVLFNLRMSGQHALQEVSISIEASVADFTGLVQSNKEIR
jgi:hypothetical protein